MRGSILTIVWMSILWSPASGAGIQLINNLPSSYLPGQAVDFDVLLPELNDLGSYQIDLVLESSIGMAGLDFYFDIAATIPSQQQYIFPSATYFFDALNVESSTRHRITLTDYWLEGVNIVPGINDHLAHVIFRTNPSFSSPLTLFVDSDSLILDTPESTSTPVQGFEILQNQIADAGIIEIAAVPEPSSASIFFFGLIVVGAIYARKQHLKTKLTTEAIR